ncbi:MAG: sensor histidine kinase [Halioglobus sp.]|nr:sensor histidine kinase [Halioglobus sp.]
MQPVAGPAVAANESVAAPDFFIPDLCAPRSVFAMVLLCELLAIVYVLANSTLPQFDWGLLAICSLYMQWVVLLSAALLCWLRRPLSRLSLAAAAAGSLLVVLAVTALSSLLALYLYPQPAAGSLDGWWLLRNLLVAVLLTGILLRYFYLQQQLRRQEKLELQARLDSLRARMRPHFLFNAMNSIASLIMSRPEAAEQAVEDLSELFRASLQESHHPTTVADELHLCELYLGIEQLRLGERLRVEWRIEAAAREVPMPSLMLQPLVENAVYHGISQLPRGGTITVAVHLAEGALCVRVDNPVPQAAAHTAGHRMALANIRERLHAIYGARARLEALPGAGAYCIELRYPAGVAP